MFIMKLVNYFSVDKQANLWHYKYMELTRNFKKLNKNNADLAGGKGASLGEMTQAGIPVPPGFVVLAESFEHFIKETDLIQEIDTILHKVKHNEIHTVEAASEQIRELILNVEMPKDIAEDIKKQFKELDTKYVAVRSSATAEDGKDHAWAGQLESYLNTTEDDVLTKVKLCWSSLFTPRAIFYRFEKGLHSTKISVAVVIQKMVESEISGIAFSVHPVTEDHNQLIIEAGFGLGEAIVSGSITPDSYVVEKEPRNILDINISTQDRALYRSENTSIEHGNNEWVNIPEPKASSQVLTEPQILELSEIILKIENHYGFPCDIEWAYEGGKFYIVQSRPITTLGGDSKEVSNFWDIDINHYQLLFQFPNMPFLLHDHFIENYKYLDGLCYCTKNAWVSYIPKTVVQKTLKDGLELFSDSNKFANYDKDFKTYRNESESFFNQTLLKERLSKDEISLFFSYAAQFHSYYIKTEFFYTDDFYQESLNNSELQPLVNRLGEIKNWGREYLNKAFLEHESYLNLLIAKLSSQFSISLEDLFWYSIKEVVEIFDSRTVSSEIIEHRKNAYISKTINGELQSLFGNEALHVIDQIVSMSSSENHELKGVIANKGHIKARARVFKYGFGDFAKLKDLINEMKEGEILVAETTSPEIISACKKASAILTNQGGLMAHAAIVSRELNIPCVVALGNATEIIKTGDMVEVNADTGVITIIK